MDFLEAAAVRVDPNARTVDVAPSVAPKRGPPPSSVACASGPSSPASPVPVPPPAPLVTLEYDTLVYACGVQAAGAGGGAGRGAGVPGVAEHCYFLKVGETDKELNFLEAGESRHTALPKAGEAD